MAEFCDKDRERIRELARRVAEIAVLPQMDVKRELWRKHHSLQRTRPLVLIFPEGSWRELITSQDLECQGDRARSIEWQLLARIYHFNHFNDDFVFERKWYVHKDIKLTSWGLDAKRHLSEDSLGAWAFNPVIESHADLAKLVNPDVLFNEAESLRSLEFFQSLFGDILDVQAVGIKHISFHLMSQYTSLRGLEQTLWDMVDQPDMVHEAMTRLEEGHKGIIRQYEQMRLLTLNNDDTYQSSGGVGYTEELPAQGFDPSCVRPCDMWASAEAQELATVSPHMHREFSLQYESRLLSPFGLCGYGCCEDLTHKLDDVLTIPGIRRISISPFADVRACAERLGARAIYSWKPHPAHLVGDFNPDQIRAYIEEAIMMTEGCVVEMILKDTHTCESHPERFDIWSRIAMESANKA